MAWLRTSPKGWYSVSFRIAQKTYQRAFGTRDPVAAEYLLGRLRYELAGLREARVNEAPLASALVRDRFKLLEFLPENSRMGDVDIPIKMLDGRMMPPEEYPPNMLALAAILDTADEEAEPSAPSALGAKSEPKIEAVFALYREKKKANEAMPWHIRHLARHLKKPFARINADDLQGYANKRLKEKYNRRAVSPQTVAKELATFGTIWRWGIAKNLCNGPVPTADVDLPAKAPGELWRPLSETENYLVQAGDLPPERVQEIWHRTWLPVGDVIAFLQSVKATSDAQGFAMLATAALTGMRRSEVARSQVEDWDWPNNIVYVRETKRNPKGSTFTRRAVPILPALKAIVSPQIDGKPFAGCCWELANRKRVEDVLRDLVVDATTGTRFENIRGWHTLRHSLRSNLENAGVDDRIVDAILGHDGRSAVKRAYSHRDMAQLHEAVGRLGIPDAI